MPKPVCPLTWPLSVFSPHPPSQPVIEPGARVKFPARLDLGGQALPPSLPCGQLGPQPGLPVRCALPQADTGRTASAGPGVRASSTKVARLQQSALRALPRLILPVTHGGVAGDPPETILQTGGSETRSPALRSRGRAPTQLPPTEKLSSPCVILNPNDFQVRVAYNS